jgi:NDP-sugar pyrophosphorylase family protein
MANLYYKGILNTLQQYGIRDVVVNVHHFADQLIETIIKSKGWGSQDHNK